MDKEQLKSLLTALLGVCIDADIKTIGEFYQYHVLHGLVVDGKKIILNK